MIEEREREITAREVFALSVPRRRGNPLDFDTSKSRILKFHRWEYRNKESSQTTLEAETDEARSKDLKMHVTENNEISSKEKSTTNLDLARDRQIRRKTCKHYNRWNEQGSNLRLDAAPMGRQFTEKG